MVSMRLYNYILFAPKARKFSGVFFFWGGGQVIYFGVGLYIFWRFAGLLYILGYIFSEQIYSYDSEPRSTFILPKAAILLWIYVG